jgi:hypothetical protein
MRYVLLVGCLFACTVEVDSIEIRPPDVSDATDAVHWTAPSMLTACADPVDTRDLLGLAPEVDWSDYFATADVSEEDYATALRVKYGPHLDR